MFMKDFEYKNGIFIYYLPKELDHFAADRLKNKTADLFDENIRYLVFDFKNTVLMDSSGIGLVMGRYKAAKAYGGKITVTGASSQIKKVMKLAGLSNIANIKKGGIIL